MTPPRELTAAECETLQAHAPGALELLLAPLPTTPELRRLWFEGGRRTLHAHSVQICETAKAAGREDLTDDEERAWHTLEDFVDRFDKETPMPIPTSTTPTGEDVVARRTEPNPIADDPARPPRFRNAETGELLRVLGPTDSFRHYVEAKDPDRARTYGRLTLVQCLRALVRGPRSEVEKRALAEGTDSAGGFTVPTIVLAQFIDLMRARSVTMQAGAQIVPLESDVTHIAQLLTDPPAGWRAENAVVVDTPDPTFGAVVLTARSLAGITIASRELIADSVNAEQMLERALAGKFAAELDRVALVGSGTAPEPRGIVNFAGIGTVAGAALTAANAYPFIISAIGELWADNAASPTAVVMAPRTLAKLESLQDTTNQALMRPPLLRDTPFFQTTSVPVTDAPGTASKIIVGDFRDLLIGVRSEMRVELLREKYAGNYQVGFLAHMRADIGLAHVQSFATVTGIVP